MNCATTQQHSYFLQTTKRVQHPTFILKAQSFTERGAPRFYSESEAAVPAIGTRAQAQWAALRTRQARVEAERSAASTPPGEHRRQPGKVSDETRRLQPKENRLVPDKKSRRSGRLSAGMCAFSSLCLPV